MLVFKQLLAHFKACCSIIEYFRELRLALASKISLGNKLLDLDLVPREEDGRAADPDQQGIAHLFNVVSHGRITEYLLKRKDLYN
jgi:hypothetical protein